MAKEKATVLGISKYSFHNEEGKLMEGGSIHYMSDYNFNEPDKKGFFPIKESITVEIFASLDDVKFPCVCELDEVKVPNAKGKTVIKIIGVKALDHKTDPLTMKF
jgi:hypothetical protein